MKKSFPGYYRPTQDEFKVLWDNCLFVLDASVLLNLYRYSSDTCNELIDTLRKISNRIWIPNQVAFEYHKNRINIISKQKDAYNDIVKLVEDSKNQLFTNLNNYLRHPFIDVESIITQLSQLFTEIINNLKDKEESHPDLLEKDILEEHIKGELDMLFDNKVGPKYSQDTLTGLFKEAEKRYENKIPPGYLDEKHKDDEKKFGDFIIWRQLIDKAKEDRKPIIFIIDDYKEDWWWKFQGKTIGPRPELIEEFSNEVDTSFYMYRSD